MNIPIDADEYVTYQKDFEKAFKKYHPGRTLDVDIEFEDLNTKVQRAYFKYRHLYWLLAFEKAREDFDLPYTYYLVPDSKTHNVIYMIDGERTSRAKHLKILEESPEYKPFDHPQGDEEEYMYLSDEYHNDRDKYAVEWDTWETGKEPLEFAIAMVDLNDLKKINDTYGHEKGNKAIISLSKILCDMFQHSKVYRIGGDEFAAILLGEDYRNRDALVEKFCSLFERMRADENLQTWERISAAIGMAVYDPEEDSRVNDVFRRADVLMYENKKRMKNAIDKSVPEA